MISAGLDLSQFNAAFDEYIKWNKREIPKLLNNKLARIVFTALKETPKADRKDIEDFLTTNTVRVRSEKTGKLLKKTRLTFGDRKKVYALTNYWLKRRGYAPVNGEAMTHAAARFVARRIRSIGTLKAGWASAARIMARVAGIPERAEKTPRVKQQSTARPAKETDDMSAVATATYNLLASERGSNPGDKTVHKYVLQAAQRAFDAEAKDMLAYVTRKMQEGCNKVNGR